MILKRFSNLKPGTVFCMLSLVEKKCVPARSENRESGPTAFQIIFLESLNSRKNWLSHFPRTHYICRNIECLDHYILRTIWIRFFGDVKKGAILSEFVKCT